MDLFLNNEECTVCTKKFGARRARKNKSLGEFVCHFCVFVPLAKANLKS
jgi:hypothetical protein